MQRWELAERARSDLDRLVGSDAVDDDRVERIVDSHLEGVDIDEKLSASSERFVVADVVTDVLTAEGICVQHGPYLASDTDLVEAFPAEPWELSPVAVSQLRDLDERDTGDPATYDELLAQYFGMTDSRFDPLSWETTGDATDGENVAIEATFRDRTIEQTIEVPSRNRINCAQLIPFLNDVAIVATDVYGDERAAMGFMYTTLPMRRFVFHAPVETTTEYIAYFDDVKATLNLD